MDEIRVVALSGLGLLPLDPSVSLDYAVARNPSVIAMDAGSGDIGPYYLGADAEYNPISWERNDLKLLLLAARTDRGRSLVNSSRFSARLRRTISSSPGS